MAIIEVEHVTKEYRLGAMQSLKTIAGRMLARVPPDSSNFKALDDISFSIEQGEVVGLVGHNGAGKSTLLKLISKIITPSSGHARIGGTVSPMIEVGSGLIGDMTGRENIILNATILGVPRKIIEAKILEIIAFSELEQFIDTPVKRYSSGMQAKLGFSIATTVDCDILIIDEVLSVGDLAFQKKCYDRMEKIIKSGDQTVILVSHNLRQITRICNRALLLKRGRLVEDGEANKVCDMFLKMSNETISSQLSPSSNIVSSNEVELINVGIHDGNGIEIKQVYSEQEFIVSISFKIKERILSPLFVVGTQTSDMIYLSAAEKRYVKDEYLDVSIVTISYKASSFPVKAGYYSIRCGIYDSMNRPIFIGESIYFFEVKTNHLELNRPGNRLLELDDSISILQH